MASRSTGGRPASTPAGQSPERSNLVQEIARIGGMNFDALRMKWRRIFGSEPPPAFSKDLLARAIAYRLQEQALGGLNASTARLLRSLLKPGAEPPRHVKVGSVIVREHKGVIHEVLIVPGGFCWQGQTFDSLSTIAKKITGVTWNGPRFFGLRSKKKLDENEAATTGVDTATNAKQGSPPGIPRVGRRSSLRSLSARFGART